MMIKYFNRKSQNYEIENVAGGKYLKWTYSSACGMRLLEAIVKKKLFSKIYGNFCDSKLSKIKINKFIEQFNIDMNESLNDKTEFRCFNDFFTRKLKLSARPLSMAPSDLVSPCDSRLMCYTDINYKSIIQVKGFTYSLEDLIKDHETALSYDGGTVMVFRLCPTDYHRFHFIDSGSCSKSKKINGFYYSVNPIALKSINNLFCQNKREWSTFHSENFKDVLYIEVGATCVGSIIQTYKPEASIKKGSEKGYFKFGGSTVILVFKKDTIKIDDDILEKSLSGIETLIKMGETIGKKA